MNNKISSNNSPVELDERQTISIVSSSHLADDKGLPLSEFEYALTMVNNAFQRWMVCCSNSANHQELSPLDILIIHNINHRERAKRIADVAFTLNIEDVHTVSYSVRKMQKSGLLQATKKGKDNYYSLTEKGQEFCAEYRRIRDLCLMRSMEQLQLDSSLGDVAAMMRTLSGLYDQASRAAHSL
ncbi:winged helix DNA-binding protein [Endozoicomonas sp. OPT23]|uniref:winged helix DNA-binding protein n=1 Tax=Endozoicomonas sp. OPT23 TaxID=2072845 RepID=UPI001E58A1EE|nr:winged helix DNA-binding protein [Endozoicomonas sp. OPT23]